MAKIDQDGVHQINQHVMNPMRSIYDKLDPKTFEVIRDEFQHVVDFVKDVDSKWTKDDADYLQVNINGRTYIPEGK